MAVNPSLRSCHAKCKKVYQILLLQLAVCQNRNQKICLSKAILQWRWESQPFENLNFWRSVFKWWFHWKTGQFFGIWMNECYSTVTCKVLLNPPQHKLGQLCADRCSRLIRRTSSRRTCQRYSPSKNAKTISFAKKEIHKFCKTLPI